MIKTKFSKAMMVKSRGWSGRDRGTLPACWLSWLEPRRDFCLMMHTIPICEWRRKYCNISIEKIGANIPLIHHYDSLHLIHRGTV